jgi:type II secretory pathway component PulF
MNYSGKEEFAVVVLRKFLIPVEFGFSLRDSLELSLDSKELQFGEAAGMFPKGSVKKSLKKLSDGAKLSEALAELEIFSEYDLNILQAGERSCNLQEACKALIDFYTKTYRL